MAKIHWHKGCKYGSLPPAWDGWSSEYVVSCEAKVFCERSADSPKHYCVNCSNAAHEEVTPKLRPITDSDRYADLRKLVEAWQSHTVGSSQSLADWRHR